MQVGKENFPATLKPFEELLSTCAFYAFDEEMTGITVPGQAERITFSPQETYEVKRAAASRYAIIQVGVCLFHPVVEPVQRATGEKVAPARYVARPFNFLLFPNLPEEVALSEAGTDVVVSPSSLAFLRKHGMNFQSWVYEGLSFCDAAQEQVLRNFLEAKQAKHKFEDGQEAHEQLLTEEEQAWIEASLHTAEDLCDRTEAMVGTSTAQNPVSLGSGGGKEAFLLPQRSKMARILLETKIKQKYPDVAVAFRRSGPTYTGSLVRLSQEERKRQAFVDEQLRKRELADALGFRLVFKALVESRKPCVGHNCFADLLFLCDAFDQSLPESLKEWKVRVAELFPQIIDTKYLSTNMTLFRHDRFHSTHLGDLFKEYGLHSAKVQVELPLGFQAYDPLTLLKKSGRSSRGDPSHEAGYDALMTGIVALNLLAELGLGMDTVPTELINKVALYRSLYAVALGDTNGDEYRPGAQEVLDLQHAPTIKTYHLESFFAKSGLPDTTLHPVDDCHTLAILAKEAAVRALGLAADVDSMAPLLNLRCGTLFQASTFRPPHARSVPSMSVAGGLHHTAPSLCRRIIMHR